MIDEKRPKNDIVISSRIRLARNIADFPFVSTCSNDQLSEIESAVRAGLQLDDQLNQLSLINAGELDELERQFLLDLQLASAPRRSDPDALRSPADDTQSARPVETRDTKNRPNKSANDPQSKITDACVDELESLDNVSLTINEEDHLRMTINRKDLDLVAAWEQISQLDDMIEQNLNFAFSPRWGYLTACPANVGTGMRVSVLVHLPALTKTRQIDKIFRSLQRVNVIARGVFGDDAPGDFYRVSNQATLGLNEPDLIEQITGVVPALVKYERQARKFLLKENKEGVRREVTEALEQLCRWDLDEDVSDDSQQVMILLSKVRMGLGMGLLDQADANRVNRLFALVHLRNQLVSAVAKEDYRMASKLQDQIEQLEQGHWDEGESV